MNPKPDVLLAGAECRHVLDDGLGSRHLRVHEKVKITTQRLSYLEPGLDPQDVGLVREVLDLEGGAQGDIAEIKLVM